MRMKTVDIVHTATQWIQRIVEVRLPVAEAAGLRTMRGDSEMYQDSNDAKVKEPPGGPGESGSAKN